MRLPKNGTAMKPKKSIISFLKNTVSCANTISVALEKF